MSKGTRFEKFLERSGLKARPNGGRPCLTCSLPVPLRDEVTELRTRERPVSYNVISKYLKDEHNHEIGGGAIEGHFRKGHAK